MNRGARAVPNGAILCLPLRLFIHALQDCALEYASCEQDDHDMMGRHAFMRYITHDGRTATLMFCWDPSILLPNRASESTTPSRDKTHMLNHR
ncbi:hypothetical protein MRB53_039720 [Persea americana]|nr:hypothetical protein MRB53_039720 [Persea americana]